MSSDFGNSEQNLCGAYSVSYQLLFYGPYGSLLYNRNYGRINTNRVRVSLEFGHNEASSFGCIPSSEWFRYYLIARKNKRKKAAHIYFRLRCFDNIAEIKRDIDTMEYQPHPSAALSLPAQKCAKSSPQTAETHGQLQLPKASTYTVKGIAVE